MINLSLKETMDLFYMLDSWEATHLNEKAVKVEYKEDKDSLIKTLRFNLEFLGSKILKEALRRIDIVDHIIPRFVSLEIKAMGNAHRSLVDYDGNKVYFNNILDGIDYLKPSLYHTNKREIEQIKEKAINLVIEDIFNSYNKIFIDCFTSQRLDARVLKNFRFDPLLDIICSLFYSELNNGFNYSGDIFIRDQYNRVYQYTYNNLFNKSIDDLAMQSNSLIEFKELVQKNCILKHVKTYDL